MNRFATAVAIASTVVGCGESGPEICADGNPYGFCDEAVFEYPRTWTWGEWPAFSEGPAIVSRVAAGEGEGRTVVTLLDQEEGPQTLDLPVAPALVPDDEVMVTRGPYGWTITKDGAFVAFVGSGTEDQAPFQAAAAREDATLTLNDVTFGLIASCAGPFERRDGFCPEDVGAIAFALEHEGSLIGPRESATVTVGGRTRIVEVRRLFDRDDRFASQCTTCGDSWGPFVGVVIVPLPE